MLAGLEENPICPCLCIFLPGKRRSPGGCVLPSRTIASRTLFAGNGLNTGGPNLPALFFHKGRNCGPGMCRIPQTGEKFFQKRKKFFSFRQILAFSGMKKVKN
jgi:hypothetical protein